MNINDWRHIENGLEIPTESYSDQPYIVKTDDGAWLCTLTTGAGIEGEPGQHVISMRSCDKGITWENAVDVEPADGPESSYSVLLKIPSGRIYCFYNHNTDNLRQVKADNPPYENGLCDRVDSLGYFVFKYSDDYGKSWSSKRYPIPIREMEIDRNNPYGGKIQFFWNVGRAFTHNSCAYVPLTKVGGFGEGFFTSSEGVLLKSSNLMNESNPEKITWETLPDGDKGIQAPKGGNFIAEEHSFSILSDDSFFCVFRTVDAYPSCTYSRDGGKTWDATKPMTYADGSMMKHSRAANFAWKCTNGKYLYWFHNHGGKDYDDRNPVWLCGGVEVDSPQGKVIAWSQPEIVIYDDDPFVRMSYPDLIEDDGKYYLTETQKDKARVHEIPVDFINRIWESLEISLGIQSFPAKYENNNLLLKVKNTKVVKAPKLPEFYSRDFNSSDHRGMPSGKGFSLELIVDLNELKSRAIIKGRRPDDRGIALNIIQNGCLELIMDDGCMEQRMKSEPCIKAGKPQHIIINIDGGPRIASFIVNGHFCDGGEYRQFGWIRFSPYFKHINWVETWELNSVLKQLKVYNHALTTSESVNSFSDYMHKKENVNKELQPCLTA